MFFKLTILPSVMLYHLLNFEFGMMQDDDCYDVLCGFVVTGVLGDGFMASGLTIQNTAGPDAHQAVAFRSIMAEV